MFVVIVGDAIMALCGLRLLREKRLKQRTVVMKIGLRSRRDGLARPLAGFDRPPLPIDRGHLRDRCKACQIADNAPPSKTLARYQAKLRESPSSSEIRER